MLKTEMSQDYENLQAQYELKCKELYEIKDDILQLSTVISQLSELNKDLSELSAQMQD